MWQGDREVRFPRVLLTGGNGLVGRGLAAALRDRYEVTHLECAVPEDGLPCIQADLRDAAAAREACTGMDAVMHVAGLHGVAWERAGDEAGFEVNVTGTKNLLEAARLAGVRRFVFTSSIWANGHGTPPPTELPIVESMDRAPAELYGLTKLLGETMCRYTTANYGLSTIVLRPGGIVRAESYSPHNGAYLRGGVDVRDVVSAHVLALEAPETLGHQVFNITADSPLCRADPSEFRRDPVGTLESVAPGARALVEAGELQVTADMEWYSIAAAQAELGYRPQYGFQVS